MLLERRVLANTIEYTKNPPGKETQCLANTVSSFPLSQLSGNLLNSPPLREEIRVQPTCGHTYKLKTFTSSKAFTPNPLVEPLLARGGGG